MENLATETVADQGLTIGAEDEMLDKNAAGEVMKAIHANLTHPHLASWATTGKCNRAGARGRKPVLSRYYEYHKNKFYDISALLIVQNMAKTPALSVT